MLIIFILSNSWSFCCATVVAACRKYSKVLCLWMLPPCELEMAVLALRECETAPIVLGNKTNPSPWWAHRHNSMKVQSQIQQRRLILDQKKKKKEILHYECKTVQIDDESLMTIRAVSEFLTINLFFSFSFWGSLMLRSGLAFLRLHGFSCFSILQLSRGCFAFLTVVLGSFSLSLRFYQVKQTPCRATFLWHGQELGELCYIRRWRPQKEKEKKGIFCVFSLTKRLLSWVLFLEVTNLSDSIKVTTQSMWKIHVGKSFSNSK